MVHFYWKNWWIGFPSVHFTEGYAEKYNKGREKEELQKLKDKYSDVSDEQYSSSESEDDDAEALTDKLEKEWLQTLTALKCKDSKIYHKNTKFYDKSSYLEEIL